MKSTNGVTYNLLWDGISTAVRDHWRIIRAEEHGDANKVQLERLTVFFSGPLQDELTLLDENRLDEALLKLFGMAHGTETETPIVREERPIHLSAPVSPIFQQTVRYPSHANLNGRRTAS